MVPWAVRYVESTRPRGPCYRGFSLPLALDQRWPPPSSEWHRGRRKFRIDESQNRLKLVSSCSGPMARLTLYQQMAIKAAVNSSTRIVSPNLLAREKAGLFQSSGSPRGPSTRNNSPKTAQAFSSGDTAGRAERGCADRLLAGASNATG